MKPPALFIVQTTVASRMDAKKLTTLVINSKLAACVQFFPIRSVYRWKGRIESAAEYLLSAKTRSDLVPNLIAFIRDHHSYETPELVAIPVTHALDAYQTWVAAETMTPIKSGVKRSRFHRKPPTKANI